MKYPYVFTFLTILIVGTACNGLVKKGLPKETEHPKLIKTIGDPRYGNVQCGLQDKAGNLWFGTTENGLYKYDGISFSRFLMADGLNSNNICSMLEDKDGKIWIGTEAGLCVYRGKSFAKIQIPLPKNLPPNKNPLYRNSHSVFSIMQAKSGKLWFATIDGVYIYDARLPARAGSDGNGVGQGKSLSKGQAGPPTGQAGPPTGRAGFTRFIVNDTAGGYCSTNNNVERILEDKAGNIWFGGRGNEGVYRYDGKSVTNIKLKALSTIRYDSNRINHVWAWPQLQDKDGNIWFSNWGGAYRYDGKSFTSFTKKDGLSGDMVTRIIEDKKGNLWFGGDGLTRYDARLPASAGSDGNDGVGQGKSFTRFTTKDGLANLGVWSILEDTTGNIWVGTRETGLYLFDARLPARAGSDGNDKVGQGKTFITYSEYKH